MQTTNVKEEARQLVERLPEGSTWEDLMHEIYVRQAIEAGLADSDVQARYRCQCRPRPVRAAVVTVQWTDTALHNLQAIHD